jgi:hypothetical protein
MNSPSKVLPWFGTGLLAAAGLLSVLKAAQGGYDAGRWPGILLGVASVFAIFAAIDTRNAHRLRTLARLNPAGFTANVATYRELPRQLHLIENLLGVPRSKVRSSSYASVSVDSDFLRIYGGAWTLKELVALPVARMVDIRIAERPQGKWTLACIELDFGSGKASESLDLCMITSRCGWDVPSNWQPPKRITLGYGSRRRSRAWLEGIVASERGTLYA